MEFLEAAGQALAHPRRRSKKRKPSAKHPTQKHHGHGTPHRRASTLRPALRMLGLGSKGPKKEPIPHGPGQPRQPANNSSGNGGDAAKPLPTKAVPDHKHSQKVLGGGWPVKPAASTNANVGAMRISARDALWFHALRAPRKPSSHFQASHVGHNPHDNPHGHLNQRERPETSTINNGPAGATNHQHAPSHHPAHAPLPPLAPAPARAPNPPTTTSKNNTTTTNLVNSIANLNNTISAHSKNKPPHHPAKRRPEPTNPQPNNDDDDDPPSPTPTLIPSNSNSNSEQEPEPTPTTRFEPFRRTSWRLQAATGMIGFLPNGATVVLDRRRDDVFRRQVDLVAQAQAPGLALPLPLPLGPPPGLGLGPRGYGHGSVGGRGHGVGHGHGHRDSHGRRF